MKNAKTFAKRIKKSQQGFSVMGQMLIDQEIDFAEREFLLEVLAALDGYIYPYLEKVLLRKVS